MTADSDTRGAALPVVVMAGLSASIPMGQQRYEDSLEHALGKVAARRLSVRRIRITSLRSARELGRRMPLRAALTLPYLPNQFLGTAYYGRARLLHRLDLRCPPSFGPEVLTIHDLAPLRFSDEGRLARSAAESVRRARVVLCPSTFAAEEVAHFFDPRRLAIVPNGVSSSVGRADPLTPEERSALGIEGRFVLHAGGVTKRKNLDALAGAWSTVAAASPDVWLVLCGPPDARRDKLFGALPRTLLLGYVADPLVARLMRSASVMVVPSTYEGFGLPALEAMAAAAPVVAADAGALPEVCGDAAVLVPPTADGLAEGLMSVLTDGALCDTLRESGLRRAGKFTWEGSASILSDVYEEELRS